MKTYWRYQSELDPLTPTDRSIFTRLGVADDLPGAVASLCDFIADRSGTMPDPLDAPEITVELIDGDCCLTLID